MLPWNFRFLLFLKSFPVLVYATSYLDKKKTIIWSGTNQAALGNCTTFKIMYRSHKEQKYFSVCFGYDLKSK